MAIVIILSLIFLSNCAMAYVLWRIANVISLKETGREQELVRKKVRGTVVIPDETPIEQIQTALNGE